MMWLDYAIRTATCLYKTLYFVCIFFFSQYLLYLDSLCGLGLEFSLREKSYKVVPRYLEHRVLMPLPSKMIP